MLLSPVGGESGFSGVGSVGVPVAGISTAAFLYYASPGNTSFAVRTVAIIIYSTLNVHMAFFAPVTVVATVSAVLTVVFLEAVAVSAIRAAVITAAADPGISNKFSAKVAICRRFPCICRHWKYSCKYDTAQQNTKQLIQIQFCFHKQFLLVSFRHFAG